MDLFKWIFNRKRSTGDDSPKRAKIILDDKNLKNTAYDQQSIIAGDITDSTIIQIIEKGHDSGPIVNEKIDEEIEIIRKSRFYSEFDTALASLNFSRRLERELSGGSDAVRCKALAWCSRFLSHKDLDKAQQCLNLAKQLGNCTEIEISEAFIHSQKGDKQTALHILANLGTPLSHSASLIVIENHEGAKAAVEWLASVGINMSDLDSDGKLFLLTFYFQIEQWDTALSSLDSITDDDLRRTPALNHIVAMTHLVSAVPHELRTVVLYQVPFYAAAFPLAADTNAMEARRIAGRFFASATETSLKFNLYNSAKIFEEYELWLALKDPSQSEQTSERLRGKLRDSKSALRLVRLGLQFGIKLDLGLVEAEIERQIALHGGITQDAAIARFSLAFTQKTPEDIANYIARHFDELTKYFAKKSIQFLQIEMFSQAGMSERAKACFDVLMKEGLSEAEETRLLRAIAEIDGTNAIESCKEQFRKTDALNDLMILVEELEARGELIDLCKYSEIIFVRTRSLHDAERLVTALSKTQKYERLVEFLRANSEFLVQSKKLHMLYCWALYNEGDLLESRAELLKITDDGNPNYRLLQVNLGIASGDWNSLTAFVAKDFIEKEKRSAQELIHTAQIAHYLGSPYAKELTFAAAEKGHDDADVLAAAYYLASNAGWEGSIEVFQWLKKAAEISDDNGPIQKKSLKDILDMKPDWDRLETETLQLLSCGEIPMFIAGESLNRSLIHMMLFPALANLSQIDPRRRAIVPAYSGIQQLPALKTFRVVAMDPTVLITLSLLKILDKALDLFETVYLPHSTLKWLFEEKQKASFHQPSRIKDAYQLQRLFSMGIVEKLISNTVPDSGLLTQIGDELALLIAEAKKASNGIVQCIVVRPYPVYRSGSLMKEEVDLGEYANILSSCQAIVDKLKSKGQITVEEEKKARAYLQLNEKLWPNQLEIADRAILYLDNLAITYFQHLGLLEKLKAAGFRVIVSPSALSKANELTSYECISDQINDSIEQIRSAVSIRLQSGKIKIGRRCSAAEIEEQSISGYPSVEIIALSRECEGIFIDDRFLNQHANMGEGGVPAPIFSTLDLLDMLVSSASISTVDLSGYKTLLRRAGYFFVSISDCELAHHLNAVEVKGNKVIETAELKAIRENILHVQMSTWLQLPKEAAWLDRLLKTFIRVLRNIWIYENDISSMRARSNWILNQIDARRWAHCLGNEAAEAILLAFRGEFARLLLFPLINAPNQNQAEYWNWVEEMLLVPIKDEYPELYFIIIEQYRRQIARLANMNLPKGIDMSEIPDVRAVNVQVVLKMMPPIIYETFVEDAQFMKQYGLTSDGVISFDHSNVSVQRSELFNAVRKCLCGIAKVELFDKNGKEWTVINIAKEGDIPKIKVSSGNQHRTLPNLAGLSSDRTIRLRYLDEEVSNVNLPRSVQAAWYNILSERSLEDEEVNLFFSECRDTPVNQVEFIRSHIKEKSITISSLVPASRRYFERLIGVFDGSTSICNYAAGGGRAFFKQLLSWRSYDGFLFSLLLSSHSALTVEIDVDQVASEELVAAYEFLDEHGDIVSQLGAIEVALRVLSSRPELEPILIRLIKRLCGDDVNTQDSGFNLITALFILIDGELSRIQLFTKEPPFYRRLAALTQAALIYRQIVNSGIGIEEFCEWAFNNRAGQYYLQSLADMRTEPCWCPDLASAMQLKANLLGRIMIVARNCEQNIKTGELHDLIFGTHSGSVYSLCEYPYSYYPGPLDSVEDTLKILPIEFSQEIEKQLCAEEITAKSFVLLVNSAMVFSIGTDQAELAAKALKLASYRLINVENRPQFLAILNGLATVSAITRSHALADALRILARVYRRDPQYSISAEEVMRICLIAAASYKDLKKWGDFIGEWLTELAFSDDLEREDGETLHCHLQYLCHAVPELWVSCGRAEAALLAYNARI